MGLTNEKFVTSTIQIRSLVREDKEGTHELEKYA